MRSTVLPHLPLINGNFAGAVITRKRTAEVTGRENGGANIGNPDQAKRNFNASLAKHLSLPFMQTRAALGDSAKPALCSEFAGHGWKFRKNFLER